LRRWESRSKKQPARDSAVSERQEDVIAP
jgi:hypothetical protein